MAHQDKTHDTMLQQSMNTNNLGLPMKNQISSVGTPGPAVVMHVTHCVCIAMDNPTCERT